MSYMAENVDTEKALAFLQDLLLESTNKEYYQKKEIEKYWEGYRKGLTDAKEIFLCSNYEKETICKG